MISFPGKYLIKNSIINDETYLKMYIPYTWLEENYVRHDRQYNIDLINNLYFFNVLKTFITANKRLYKKLFGKGFNTLDKKVFIDKDFMKFFNYFYNKHDIHQIIKSLKNSEVSKIFFKDFKINLKTNKIEYITLNNFNSVFNQQMHKSYIISHLKLKNPNKVKKGMSIKKFRKEVVKGLASKPEAIYDPHQNEYESYISGFSHETIGFIVGLSQSQVTKILRDCDKIYSYTELSKEEYDQLMQNDKFRNRLVVEKLPPLYEVDKSVNSKISNNFKRVDSLKYFFFEGTKTINKDINFKIKTLVLDENDKIVMLSKRASPKSSFDPTRKNLLRYKPISNFDSVRVETEATHSHLPDYIVVYGNIKGKERKTYNLLAKHITDSKIKLRLTSYINDFVIKLYPKDIICFNKNELLNNDISDIIRSLYKDLFHSRTLNNIYFSNRSVKSFCMSFIDFISYINSIYKTGTLDDFYRCTTHPKNYSRPERKYEFKDIKSKSLKFTHRRLEKLKVPFYKAYFQYTGNKRFFRALQLRGEYCDKNAFFNEDCNYILEYNLEVLKTFLPYSTVDQLPETLKRVPINSKNFGNLIELYSYSCWFKVRGKTFSNTCSRCAFHDHCNENNPFMRMREWYDEKHIQNLDLLNTDSPYFNDYLYIEKQMLGDFGSFNSLFKKSV